ncbi:metaxin-2 [Bacillus rossius redtenbacheri]|uniref:metaxin-2 n=1 Tax=Bacillus rossius redtenbacheri TaxID=93214 RepID=UPI002FDEC368
MQSSLLLESIAVEIGASEPWPSDAKLFQPYEVEQVLLPDNANCLAVQAYLKMCGLNFQVEQRKNAEYMSPSGRVPFLKCGAYLVSDLDPIITFVNMKEITLVGDLNNAEKADMRAYISLVCNVLGNAELYVCWKDEATYKELTRQRYGSVHPWPLNIYLPFHKRKEILKRLASLGWKNKSRDEVFAEVENCCKSLSDRLGDREFFFGSKPTELDAVVFGHVFTILTTPLLNNRFAAVVRGYDNLVELCKRVEKDFFERIPDA